MLLRQCLQAVHAIPGHRFLLQLLPATLGHYAASPSCAAEARHQQQQQPRLQQAAPPQQAGGQLQLVRPMSNSPEPAVSLMTQLLGNNQFASVSGCCHRRAHGSTCEPACMLLLCFIPWEPNHLTQQQHLGYTPSCLALLGDCRADCFSWCWEQLQPPPACCWMQA
jgi:hypothetical protein